MKLEIIGGQNSNIPSKADQKLMIQSTIRTSRQTKSGNRTKIYSRSAIHSSFQIRESVKFTEISCDKQQISVKSYYFLCKNGTGKKSL